MKMNSYGSELRGKNCLVFGSDSSWGKSLCRNLADYGLNLGLIDLKPKSNHDLAEAVKQSGLKSISLQVDSGDANSYRPAVDAIKDYLGGIDFLICSYYFDNDEEKNEPAPERLNMEKWDRIFRDWVESYFLITKAVLPHMIRRKQGKILFFNLTSAYTGEGEGEGQLSGDASFYYVGCGSALTGMMTSMARDIIPRGIGVNGLALGPSYQKDGERIFNSVIFLLSEISDYSCGQTLRLY